MRGIADLPSSLAIHVYVYVISRRSCFRDHHALDKYDACPERRSEYSLLVPIASNKRNAEHSF